MGGIGADRFRKSLEPAGQGGGEQWANGLRGFDYLGQNRVVHPDKHDQLPDGLASEAWLVAMYYAELIMLKLLGYDGYYRNRLNNEEVERVPWSV